MEERREFEIHNWGDHKCNIAWPKEAAYGTVLIARAGDRIVAYLVADHKPVVAYALRAEEVPKFHAVAAEHWYEHERAGSFSVLSGTTSKGGIVRPLPPPPPFPVGHPNGLLAQVAQLSSAAANQFESIAEVLVSVRGR